MEHKKALVTGAAGFIGRHLASSLLSEGWQVRALDLPSRDMTDLQAQGAELMPADIRIREDVEKAVRGIHTVFHLAAISRHDTQVPDQEYKATNVTATNLILEAAEADEVKTVLFTSTIESVGFSKDGKPLTEETPQTPRNIYGESKLEAERNVVAFNDAHRVKTVVVRPPMTYGPGEMLLLQRMFKIVQWGFFPMIGGGRAQTEFCFVENQVHGIKLAAEKGGPGEVYFISDERPYSIREIIEHIGSAIPKKVQMPAIPVPLAWCAGLLFEMLAKVLRFYPFVLPQTGRPPFARKSVTWLADSRLYVDISKAKRELGYEPLYSLDEGIRKTVDWYRSNGLMKQSA